MFMAYYWVTDDAVVFAYQLQVVVVYFLYSYWGVLLARILLVISNMGL
jgi:hypothetical protein